MTPGGLPAEAQARQRIDADLVQAGWAVQDRDAINLSAAQGVAVREVPMGDGRVDYLLYLNQKIVGVIEAKPAGTTLAEVHSQAMRYATSLTPGQKLNAVLAQGILPFVYEASSTELYFSNHFDPEPTSRRIFNFQRPSTLEDIIRSEDPVTGKGGWRSQIQTMPGTEGYDLRPASERAIHNIERWLQTDGRRRALVQMATGAGKTRICRSSKNLGVSLRNLRVNSPPREFGPLGRLVRPFLDLMALGLSGYSTGRSAVYGLAIWASLWCFSVIRFGL